MKLQDFHWLLLISKQSIRYSEQAERWNNLVAQFRAQNKGPEKVEDHLGQSLSLHSVYQD